jgi:hypothetical protein
VKVQHAVDRQFEGFLGVFREVRTHAGG